MSSLIGQVKLLFRNGFFHLLISNYSVQFIVFASHLLIAKIMSPASLGIVKILETYANIAVVLGSGGIIFAVLKVVPATKQKSIRRDILGFSLKYVLSFSIVIFLLLYSLNYLGFLFSNPKAQMWFFYYSWIIIPAVITSLLIRFYQSIDKFKRISSIVVLTKTFSAIIVLTSTLLFFLKGYIWSMVITAVMVLLLLIVDLRKEISLFTRSTSFIKVKEELILLSKQAFLAQIVDQIKLHAIFICTSFLILDKIQFGYFSFSLILIQGLNIVSTSVQQFSIPSFSKRSHNYLELVREQKEIEKKLVLVIFIISFVAQLIVPYLVEVLFDDKYEGSILCFRILLVGWFIQSFYALKGALFLSLGKMKYITYSSLIILIITLPVLYFLSRKYGIIGASIAYCFQNLISYAALRYYCNQLERDL